MGAVAGEGFRPKEESSFIPHKTVTVRLVLSLYYRITGLKFHSHVRRSKDVC